MEVQIRTRDMHRVAEYGVAAHWRYKQPGAEGGDGQRFAWLRQMLEWQQQLQDPQEFLRSVKEDLFTEEVFAFTPKGDLRSEEHTSELQSRLHLVCRLLLEKKKNMTR